MELKQIILWIVEICDIFSKIRPKDEIYKQKTNNIPGHDLCIGPTGSGARERLRPTPPELGFFLEEVFIFWDLCDLLAKESIYKTISAAQHTWTRAFAMGDADYGGLWYIVGTPRAYWFEKRKDSLNCGWKHFLDFRYLCLLMVELMSFMGEKETVNRNYGFNF